MKKKKKIPSVMEIKKGEKIVGAWLTPEIPDIGFYKLLAKQKVDGTCEWVHFIQRFNGIKEDLYRDELETPEQIVEIIQSINKTLSRIFGEEAVETRKSGSL